MLGLLALMEIQASRLRARTGPDGALIPVTEQDRARWDHLLIRRGLDALARAEALGGDGPYVLQAALAACHARARQAAETDWPRIAALYDRSPWRRPPWSRRACAGKDAGVPSGVSVLTRMRKGAKIFLQAEENEDLAPCVLAQPALLTGGTHV